MIARVAAASLAVLLLAGCGGSGEPEQKDNTNPHQGWVSIDNETMYRCIGADKVIYHKGRWDDSGQISTIEDSEDCK